MRCLSCRVLGAPVLCLGFTLAVHAQDYKKSVIYQVVTDRFYDGSTANNNPAQSAGLYDANGFAAGSPGANWQAYWGGDLLGIQNKLAYIKGMNATAIWISPTNDNENLNANVGTPVGAAYHGYWNRDFMRVEEHFGDTSNGWTAFSNLTAAAHSSGIKVIVDWAQNHSNANNGGENGALYNNGTLMATPANDPNGYFHHNGIIQDADYGDRYKVQYNNLANLQDLNQENATIDAYLKTAAEQFQNNGADAFRLDAIKSVTWGWQYSFANAIFNNKPSFLFGEWNPNNSSDPLYADAYKFANKSGISELDFGMNQAIRDVFGSNANMAELDSTLAAENASFTFPNNLVTFFDSQDENRLYGNLTTDKNRLHEALAFLITSRGIPNIFYGDEQYLYNTTNSGNDPYNRVAMSSFSATTTAYKVISKLAALRASNDALGYGTTTQRWINNDVYVFERQFYNDVVLVAINKSDTASYNITGLNTALPAGTYADTLAGLLSGGSLTVATGSGSNNPATAFSLGPSTVAVWQKQVNATTPEVGSIGPYVGQPGMTVTIAGDGFGTSTGSVLIGTTAATVKTWSNTSVTFTVPAMTAGTYSVTVKNSGGTQSNGISFNVLTAKLVPVTFTVNNAQPTNTGDYIFVSGSVPELGSWGTTFFTAVGPMLDPNYPSWFLNVSLPAGTVVQYKYVDIQANGNVIWEPGNNHSYTVPASGTGFVNDVW
jgi:glycosidase